MKKETRKQILNARKLSKGDYLYKDKHGFVVTESKPRKNKFGKTVSAKRGSGDWRKLKSIQDDQVIASFLDLRATGLTYAEALEHNVRV